MHTYTLLPVNTDTDTHTCGPALVASLQWEKLGSSLIGKNQKRECLLSLSSSSGRLLSNTHTDTHAHIQHTHIFTHSGGKRRTKRRWGKTERLCPEGSSWGGGGRVPRALSGQEAPWLPLFPSQQPKVSPGGSATCNPSTPVGSCETRTKASSTHHCPLEPSLVLKGTSPLQPRASQCP